MRTIFLVTPPLAGARGGVAVSALRIAAHLREAARVVIFESALELPPSTYEEVQGGLRVSLAGDRRRAHQFSSDVILAQARRTPPDALAVFYAGELLHPVALTARLLGRPLIVFARGNDIDLEVFGEEGPRILGGLGQAARVYCVTRELESKIRAWVPEARTAYVPNGVEPAEFPFRPVKRRERPVVGIFGELKPKKGLELLLAQLDFSRFGLEIVGELRPDAEKLLHGFLTLHPESAIRHLPWVGDRAALGARYGAVDIVCIPSLHEGMSNVMLEAMASGALCLCSKVGGAPDVIAHGENGLLFDPFGDELARALDEAAAMLADGRAEPLRRAARRTVEERFSSARERAAYLADLRALFG